MSFYQRPVAQVLESRLAEPPQRLQILAGPRQVGKTTLVQQVLAARPAASYHAVAADNPSVSSAASDDGMATRQRPSRFDAAPADGWVQHHWQQAERRALAWDNAKHPAAETMAFVLVLDEIQLVS